MIVDYIWPGITYTTPSTMGIVVLEDELVGFWHLGEVSLGGQLLDDDEPLVAESAANLSPPELLALLDELPPPDDELSPPPDEAPPPSLVGGVLFANETASRKTGELWTSSRGNEMACTSGRCPRFAT